MLTATPAEPDAIRGRSSKSLGRRIVERASTPTHAHSIAVFRIGFGLLVAFSAARFVLKGWVDALYLAPANHLTYAGFGWVRPLPAPLMHLAVWLVALLGLLIAVGYHHRLATGLFLIVFGYTELIEASLYLNHYWFLTVIGALLLLLPVHHHWSIDAAQGRVVKTAAVPTYVLWTLRAQVGAVYFFAGLAKINADWLFHAQPLQLWFADRSGLALIGGVLGQPSVAYVASWAAAVFDLTVVGWLLVPRTRPFAYGALVIFHTATGLLFPIGVFPMVMMLAATVFFSPAWPMRLLEIHRPRSARNRLADPGNEAPPLVRRCSVICLVFFCAFQLVLPLRHYAHQGNVRWTEEGYYLAWRVMLTDKAGHLDFVVTDPASGRSWETGPELVLLDWQASHAATRPDLVHATALLIAAQYDSEGVEGVEVRAKAMVSMNGGVASPIVDPTIDLAAQPRRPLRHSFAVSGGDADG